MFLLITIIFSDCAGRQTEPDKSAVTAEPVQTAEPEKPLTSQKIEEIIPGILKGYLEMNELPDSLALIPPPPAEGSGAYLLDLEISREYLNNTDPERLKQAQADDELYFPEALQAFNIIPGIEISQELTPALYILLKRSLTDAALSTYAAKDKYMRARPFMTNNGPFYPPEEKSALRADGSYPSAHAAIGWAWALILCEIYPENADAILQRGKEFGESRIICNVHWQSDVDQGRVMGEAAAARLYEDPVFMADLEKAKEEAALSDNR